MQFETYTALQALCTSDLERALIEPENWGKSIRDLEKDLGVPRATVARALNRLYSVAKEVLYAD